MRLNYWFGRLPGGLVTHEASTSFVVFLFANMHGSETP